MFKKRKLVKEIEAEDSTSSEEFDEIYGTQGDEDEDEIMTDETPAEKRLTLAKKYLEELPSHHTDRIECARKVGDTLLGPDLDSVKFLKNGHKLPVTCLTVSPNGKFIYSACKGTILIKWDLLECKRVKTVPRNRKDSSIRSHTGIINAIAISNDSKFLATGCDDKLIKIWCPEDMTPIHTFEGHRGAVTGLVFRRFSLTLYSCSADKTVKVWDVASLSYVETLVGHKDRITSIDVGLKERPVTSGGIDSTLRVWKIPEQTQLVFEGSQTIELVRYLNEDHFVSVGDDGSINLYSNSKKTPLCTKQLAHGEDASKPNWIVSLATAMHTDIFATGSRDGHIKIWQCKENFKKFNVIFTIPAIGTVNCLSFIGECNFLVAAVGREHRLGRWWTSKDKNYIMVVPMLY